MSEDAARMLGKVDCSLSLSHSKMEVKHVFGYGCKQFFINILCFKNRVQCYAREVNVGK